MVVKVRAVEEQAIARAAPDKGPDTGLEPVRKRLQTSLDYPEPHFLGDIMPFETETPIMKVIEEYGVVMHRYSLTCHDNGYSHPVFLCTHECVRAIQNPDGKEFKLDRWKPAHTFPDNIKNVPGLIGEYCGVLLIEAPARIYKIPE
jgi:hypothetical protein